MSEKYQRLLVGAVMVFVAGAMVFGFLVVQKLERMVVIAERSEAKIDRFIEATAPLGKATVEKGAKMIESVDHEEMTDSAQKGIKEIGTAAKQHLLEYMDKKAAENGEETEEQAEE